jgi:hypothetical protein
MVQHSYKYLETNWTQKSNCPDESGHSATNIKTRTNFKLHYYHYKSQKYLFPNQHSQEFNYRQDTNVEHGTATAYCYSRNKDGSLPAAMVTIHYHDGLVTKN